MKANETKIDKFLATNETTFAIPVYQRNLAPLNYTYFIETNIDSNGKFDRIKLALTIFGLEDELFIKYAE